MHLPEFITDLLAGIAHKEGLTNYRFETESGSNHGENFLGEITAIKLIGDRVKNGAVLTETINLMCKTAAENEQQRQAFKLVRAFEREVLMYTRVLPVFADFQKEKGLTADESFVAYPKVYATLVDNANGKYAIIMEDLRARNFVVWPRQKPVTLEHEKLIMKQLGRYHAISFALKDQRPEIFAEFEDFDDIIVEMMETGQADNACRHSIEAAMEVSQHESHRDVLRRLLNSYHDDYKTFFKKESIGKWGVLSHGDCWINNFLFQYEDNVIAAIFRSAIPFTSIYSILVRFQTKQLANVRFIDWQLTRYSSPATDLLYHIFTSTTKPLRDQSFHALIQVYHTSVLDTVQKLGSDPLKMIQFAELMDELKAHGKYALLLGLVMAPFVYSEEGDIMDMKAYSDSFASGKGVPLFKTRNAAYIKAVNDIVGDIIEYGLDH